ncbi:MAG: hypothetical protein WBN60_06375 [Polyangiales bacterium]
MSLVLENKDVYVSAREVVRELAPLVRSIREQDAKLADQLRPAAHLDRRLDRVCAITWRLSRSR